MVGSQNALRPHRGYLSGEYSRERYHYIDFDVEHHRNHLRGGYCYEGYPHTHLSECQYGYHYGEYCHDRQRMDS